MYKKLLILCILFLTSFFVNAKLKYRVDRSHCAIVSVSIKHINNELRAGYAIKRGEQLKELLRARKMQRHSCKSKGFSINGK